MNTKLKKILAIIAGSLFAITLYFYGPSLIDRVIGVIDRNTMGTFKEHRYTYKLDSNSDMLPFDIVVLPDTDIEKEYIHALVGLHYYPALNQSASEHRYYEYTDDGTLAINYNQLITEPSSADYEGGYYICRSSNLHDALIGNITDTTTAFFAINYKSKEVIPLYSTDGPFEPVIVGKYIYWTKTGSGQDQSELVRFDPDTRTQTTLLKRPGSMELLTADTTSLLYLWFDFDSEEDEYINICHYYPDKDSVVSITIPDYGLYISKAEINSDTMFFYLSQYEENEAQLGRILLHPQAEASFIPVPSYKNYTFVDCEIGGDYAVMLYEQDRSSFTHRMASVLSLKSGKSMKTINDIGSIGINDRYLFYVIKKLDRMGLIERVEIVVERNGY